MPAIHRRSARYRHPNPIALVIERLLEKLLAFAPGGTPRFRAAGKQPRAEAGRTPSRRHPSLARCRAWARRAGLPPRAFADAERLAARYTPTLGTRTLDMLHVACARSLKAILFITFDPRQAALARAVGLTVAP
ncbi:MAG: PIN domain-containing protein [Terriglobales bacterium]